MTDPYAAPVVPSWTPAKPKIVTVDGERHLAVMAGTTIIALMDLQAVHDLIRFHGVQR